MILPIKPAEVQELINKSFPDFVIQAFNSCIQANWIASSGRATFTTAKVVAEMIKIQGSQNLDSSTVYSNKWLDVEPLYRDNGWKVTYDSPAYNESYEASFTFSKRRTDGR